MSFYLFFCLSRGAINEITIERLAGEIATNPSSGPHFGSAASCWVFPRTLVLSRAPSLLRGGTKRLHHRPHGAGKRQASLCHQICILPSTLPVHHPIPVTRCLPRPSLRALICWGRCPRVPLPSCTIFTTEVPSKLTRGPWGPCCDGEESHPPHGRRAELSRRHHLGGSRPQQQQHLKCHFLAENTILPPPAQAPNVVISAHLIFFQYNKDISYFII